MHELQAVPLPEIALALGMPRLQVRALLKDARRRLREAADDTAS
jgi:DNA-directed RNA polymerase specialized sigma24 family protein